VAAGLLAEAEGALDALELDHAETLAIRAAELFATEGEDHPDVASAHLVRARVAHARSDFRSALVCAERAVAILDAASAAWPDEDIVVRMHAHAIAQVVTALHGLGRYDDAEQRALAILATVEARLGADEPEVSSLCNLLGISHKYQARFAEAAARYARALSIYTAQGDELGIASIEHNLGGLDHARGVPELAEPHARRAVELRERALGPDHPDVAADLAAWAAILDDLGRAEDAEAAYGRALAIFMHTFGEVHHEVGFTLASLGALFAGQGRWDEAAPILRRARAIQGKVHGAQHPDLALVDHYLAVVGHALGDHDEALASVERALDVFERVFAADHPRVIDARSARDAILDAAQRR